MYSPEEIFQIIKALKTQIPSFIVEARKYSKTLNALVTGDCFRDELSKIEHIEKSNEKWKAREKYAISIKDLCERVLRPLDNVYSATGESKYFNLKSERDKELIIQKLGNVRDTKSLKKWLEDNWKQVYITDPNGLIFLEYKDENSYPTYKSIGSIRYYQARGQNIDFVLFEPELTKDGNYIWRFVDELNDYRILESNNVFTVIEDLSFQHPFGFCPGIINSNIIKIGTEQRLSFIDGIVDLLKVFLRDTSILMLVKFLNGFKTLIRPRITCPTCHGVGNTGDVKCDDCKGTGFLINRDATDEITLPITLDNPDIKIPDAAGFAAYIGLDVETWNQYNSELERLEVKITDTLWGSKKEVASAQQKTQLEIWANTQPVIIALNKVSEVAEWVDWQVTEFLMNFYLSKDKTEKGCNVCYGKNFILDPPEIILERLTESYKNGVPVIIVDRQLNELITTKFRNDVEQLNIEMKKKNLEPYIFFTLKDVKEILGTTEAQRKILYFDWIKTLSFEDYNKQTELLQKEFDKFFSDKITQLKLKTDEENSNSRQGEIPFEQGRAGQKLDEDIED